MIQRIQTVWWLISAILLCVFVFFPVIAIEETEFSPVEFGRIDDNSTFLGLLGILLISICIILLTTISIFLFKKRKIQIQLGYIQRVLLILLAVVLFLLTRTSAKEGHNFVISAALFFLSAIFQLLAIRAVKKDEALIKSMDRLR